jgi:hypothetical protein
MFEPPWTPDADAALRERGQAVLHPSRLADTLGVTASELQALTPSWNALAPDGYLRDGGRYRSRRHSSFVADGDRLTLMPHRAHWQPLDYNALHGGIERWFVPVTNEVAADPAWQRLLLGLAGVCNRLRGTRPWYIETHQFRIDTSDGIGRPTPEGAHRDGVDLVAVFLVDRQGIKGGESRVFEADGPQGQRFTLLQPWTALLLDDQRVIHETTPIQPQDPAQPGWRDTLVVTLRSGGFQDP